MIHHCAEKTRGKFTAEPSHLSFVSGRRRSGPGTKHLECHSGGDTSEKGGVVPHYMGIEDQHGRLVVFISRNYDLGDAWEWINDPRYPAKYGLPAYKVGVNVVIYAMSH